VPDEQLMPQAQTLAARLAAQATVALGLTKQAFDAAETNDLARQLDLERDLQVSAAATPDHAEGLRAFREKRLASFTGRQN
jgi:2-(1,2-epoxy-1,2-dihydrophenyl)acetyl-CoA isomerase